MAITKRRSQVVMSPGEIGNALADQYRASTASLEREFDEAQEREDLAWMADVAVRLGGYRRLLAIAERGQ